MFCFTGKLDRILHWYKRGDILLLNQVQNVNVCHSYQRKVSTHTLTLSTLSNFIGLFHSLFWITLKWSVGVKGLTPTMLSIVGTRLHDY